MVIRARTIIIELQLQSSKLLSSSLTWPQIHGMRFNSRWWLLLTATFVLGAHAYEPIKDNVHYDRLTDWQARNDVKLCKLQRILLVMLILFIKCNVPIQHHHDHQPWFWLTFTKSHAISGCRVQVSEVIWSYVNKNKT